MTELELVRAVEEVAANSWPAAIVEMLDGWRLRATPSVTVRRSNSVLPNGGAGRVPLESKLAAVEDFYAGHDIPARYQVSGAAVPESLDDVLASRGFEIEAPVDIMVARLDQVEALTRGREIADGVGIESEPSEEWLDAMFEVAPRGERDVFRAAILDRIDRPVRYASVLDGREALAVGMCVADGDWLGIYSMATHPEARRRGFATAILRSLAQSGRRLGATRAYLQTERTNGPAHALYERVGFATAYGYHYRTKR
jgi:ribosomal protein S18 acetylase RimI-like enzyme